MKSIKIPTFHIKKINLFLIIDSLIILLNLSNSYSVIPYLIFFQFSRANNTIIITAINLLFIGLKFKEKILIPKHILFFIFILINFSNIISGLISGTFYPTFVAYFLANSSFYIILFNLYKKYSLSFNKSGSLNLITRGYIWLVAINIIGAISILILIHGLNFNPLVNEVSHKMDLFTSNIERAKNISYYFPLNLSIILSGGIMRIPILHKYGIITGFYHEPHTFTFIITPALFLLLYKNRNTFSRILIIITFLIIVSNSASTINVLSLLICFLVYLFFKLRSNFIFSIVITLLVILIFNSIDESLYSYIFYSLESGSKDYSLSTLFYAFTPKTLVGYNFFDLSYLKSSYYDYDVGYINFIINIFFLLFLGFKIFKLIISKHPELKTIGLFSLYFLLHSMKVAMVAYSLSFLIFVVFIISIYSDKENLSAITNTNDE